MNPAPRAVYVRCRYAPEPAPTAGGGWWLVDRTDGDAPLVAPAADGAAGTEPLAFFTRAEAIAYLIDHDLAWQTYPVPLDQR